MFRIALITLIFISIRTWAAPIPTPYLSPYLDSFPESQKKIRVRISDSVPSVIFRGFDLKLTDRLGGVLGEPDGSTEWQAICAQGKVQFSRLGSRALRETQEPLVIESPTGFVRYRGMPYRERILIYSRKNNSAQNHCEVVNVLDIEKYLDGLVNAEFSAKWDEKAIEAQVIAARTYAYFRMLSMRKNPKMHFDLDATIKDQVYDGSIREDYRATRSVQNTRGMILTASNGRTPSGIVAQPIKAFYHSTCGGRTIRPDQVWGQPFEGFKRGVSCGYCQASPSFQWQAKIRTDELWRTLVKKSALPGWPKNSREVFKVGRLVDLKVSELDPDGRAQKIDTVWNVGTQVQVLSLSAARFREWLGSTRVKSTWFSIVPEAIGVWKVAGKGNGHGVGLCQWGAKVMGEKGFNSASILKQYYPDASITRAW